jgi:hypothetical protein
LAVLKPLQLLEAPGLRTVLRSDDFGAWDSLVAGTLGHHRSRLLPGSPPFRTHIRWGAVAEFEVLLLHGRGRVELQRQQGGHGVLWLPLEGLTQEWVNGVERVAEPGMAMLIRPGDAMRGFTSDTITGLSILIPGACLQAAAPPSPLLDRGPVHSPPDRGRSAAGHGRGLATRGVRARRRGPGGGVAAVEPSSRFRSVPGGSHRQAPPPDRG